MVGRPLKVRQPLPVPMPARTDVPRPGTLLVIGSHAAFSLVASRSRTEVSTLDEAMDALRRARGGAALVAVAALGADPADGIRTILAVAPELAVVVVTDGPHRASRAMVGAGAEDVVDAGAEAAGLPWRVWAAAERHGALVEARREGRQGRLLYANATEGCTVLDVDGRVLFTSLAMAGLRSAAELDGQLAMDHVLPADRARAWRVFRSVAAQPGRTAELEIGVVDRDGGTRWLEVVFSNLVDEDTVGGIIANYWDITPRKLAEQELAHRVLHDQLTGLPNRSLLDDRLERALAAERPGAPRTGVVFVDVDGFKHVNDALGHRAADALLVEVGARLRGTVRPADTVARFEGDEFVVVCEQVDDAGLAALAERIIAAMERPFVSAEREVVLGVSLGVTLSRAGSTGPSLLSEADVAMYRAKELGRGRAVSFDDSLRGQAASALERVRALRAGLARREPRPWFQPIVDLRTGRTVGVEALARWPTADGTVLGPADFIPLAETTGLIGELGDLILRRAAESVARCNAAAPGPAPLWVSVNLSAVQIGDAGLAGRVGAILADTGLDPALLHLEITETVVMRDVAQSIVVLEQLKELGATLSIDDFGTGYSSLAYLSQLPVDMLKVDRSFVRGLGVDAVNTSIVEAVLGLGRALDLRCVAEGVETSAQRAALHDLACDFGQGYLWSRPMPEADLLAWAGVRSSPWSGV